MSAVANSARKNPQSPIRNPQFSDTDFFRRLVAERAASLASHVASFAERLLQIHVAELRCVRTNTDRTELLIRIAALCERAAVDVTIPASRSSRFKPDQPKPQKPAEIAKKKGQTK